MDFLLLFLYSIFPFSNLISVCKKQSYSLAALNELSVRAHNLLLLATRWSLFVGQWYHDTRYKGIQK